MAHRRRSLEVTDRYQRELVAIRDTTVTAVANAFATVDLEDLGATYRSFLGAAVPTVSLGQAEAVRLTDGYFSTFMSSELDELVLPAGVEPTDYAGTTRDGRPLANVLGLGLVSVTFGLAAGMSDRQALDSGLARVVRAARTEVMDAGRRSLDFLMGASDRVFRWQRVVSSSNPCGACLALDGSIRSTDASLEIHASCSCTAEPIVDGLEQAAPRVTGEERFADLEPEDQDALFAGRGGAEKAELVRSGAVPLEALITRQPSPDWGTTIYETSLSDLASE